MADPNPGRTGYQAPVQALAPVLVTDFDGTLYRGDDPIRRYARNAAERLGGAAGRVLLDGTDFYLAQGAPGSAVPEAVDGWEAVALLGLAHGLGQDDLNAAFLATRDWMATGDCVLEVPAGYARLLAGLRADGVRVVLATNSPAAGLDPLLRRLGVLPLLDQVVAGTGKPAGLDRLLRRELAGAGSAARVLVVGDHWRNDVEPGLRLGTATACIDRFGRADGPADAVAPSVEGLLDPLRTWAAGALATAPSPKEF
ncbi:HAD family hydrolase [Streptacidiphilus cavernicola]|uniref:HAD family hydrolase n=1 Tax=Streptacidiphilus cavernicola TaxID=3342716 RepID=A0ABV6W524_9ACTN